MAVMGSKNILTLIFFFSAAVVMLRTVVLLWHSYLADFSIFYQAIFVGFSYQNPYLYKDFFAPYIYPPVFLLFLYPLSFFSFAAASQIWIVSSILLTILNIFMLMYYLKTSLFSCSLVMLLTALSFPFKFTLGMGQVNILVLFSIVVFLYFSEKNKIISSVFFSVATIVKVVPLVFIYTLILKKDYWMIFLIIVCLLFSGALSILTFGYADTSYYLFHIFPSVILSGVKQTYYNQSLLGTLARFHLLQIQTFLQLIMGSLTLYILWMKKPSLGTSVSLLITMALLISSFSWQHHLILLLIPFYFMLIKAKTITRYILLFGAYALVAINISSPTFFMSSWYGLLLLSHATWGMMLLWILMMHTIYKGESYNA